MQSKGKARPPSEHFTPMPNDIIEALYHHRITGEQYRIILLIARQSWGYVDNANVKARRNIVPFAGDYLAKSLCRNVRDVNRDLQALIKRRIITVVEQDNWRKPRKLAINRMVSEWADLSRRPSRKLTPRNEPMIGDQRPNLRRLETKLDPSSKQADFAGNDPLVHDDTSKHAKNNVDLINADEGSNLRGLETKLGLVIKESLNKRKSLIKKEERKQFSEPSESSENCFRDQNIFSNPEQKQDQKRKSLLPPVDSGEISGEPPTEIKDEKQDQEQERERKSPPPSAVCENIPAESSVNSSQRDQVTAEEPPRLGGLGKDEKKPPVPTLESSPISSRRADLVLNLAPYHAITVQDIYDYYIAFDAFRRGAAMAASSALDHMGIRRSIITTRGRRTDSEPNPQYQALWTSFNSSLNGLIDHEFADCFTRQMGARNMQQALMIAAALADPMGRLVDKDLAVWIAEHATSVKQGWPSIVDTMMAMYLAETKGRNQASYANTVLRELSGFQERVFQPHVLDVVFRRQPFSHLFDARVRIPLVLARSKDTPGDTITLAHEVISKDEADKAKRDHKTSARVDRIIHGAPLMINAIIGREVYSLTDMVDIYDAVIQQLPATVSHEKVVEIFGPTMHIDIDNEFGAALRDAIDDMLSVPASEELEKS